MQKKEYALELAGQTLTATFSDLADQTNGSVLVRLGQTIVLATAVMSPGTRDDIDYFPLTVEYEEKFYATGKILGSRFQKREGRPSDEAVLSGRIVDRTIRPLFDDHIRNEIQVVVTVLSIDDQNDPDTLAVIASSLALATSNIPWNGPVSAIRIGLKKSPDAEFSVNPNYLDRQEARLDLLICGQAGKISMIESEAKEISEAKLAEAFLKATEMIEQIQTWQNQIVAEQTKTKLMIEKPVVPAEIKTLFDQEIKTQLEAVVFGGADTAKAAYAVRDAWVKKTREQFPNVSAALLIGLFEEAVNDLVHDKGLQENKRADGRALTELRPLFAEAGGLSDVVHGSGIFYRGGTHVLTVLTLGGPNDSQIVEGMEVQEKKYFMHHYNFPRFSVGETGRMGGMNRRSIGHGALAEKSLRGVIPAREVFPYTIRLVSEVMASNGSSSMGSVCASSLALMDGGVPITSPVAGIAMGLLLNEKGDYKILTDIQGPEDHYGDMDFKVAGTTNGITGIQLDIKIGGIPVPILVEALDRAKEARLQILQKISEAISAPRPDISKAAPKIIKLQIPTDKIGAIIGPGGKNIQKLVADTGAQIEIEDDGTIYITGKSPGAETAKASIEEICREYKAGDEFQGEVTRLMDFGAFVKIGRDTEGLVHISELAPFRVARVTDVVKVGETVPVVIKEVDDRGRINLSIKAIDPEFASRKGVTVAPPETNGTGNGRPPFSNHQDSRGSGPRPPHASH
ncbi:MAG: polyribonucleotide nucleotidyltransferase [Patescibacteria group bacterium]